MRDSIRGGQLPESKSDFDELVQKGGIKFYRCVDCGRPHSSELNKTQAGWRETQISGMCEKCFDQLFTEE